MPGFYSDVFGSVPGFSAVVESFASHFMFGPQEQMLVTSAFIDGAARDAGNSPATVLRRGLVLGQVAATGKLKEYSGTATDGTDRVHSVLMVELRTQDFDVNNRDGFVWSLAKGNVKAGQLIGLDEYARAQMAGRFVFDDRNFGQNNYGWNGPTAKATSYVVVNGTDNNTIFTTRGAAGAVTFTLPTTLMKGQRWKFLNEAGQNMSVAAPAGKLVAFNNLGATSITFSTAGELIGQGVEIIVNDNASKYLAMPILGAETATPTIA